MQPGLGSGLAICSVSYIYTLYIYHKCYIPACTHLSFLVPGTWYQVLVRYILGPSYRVLYESCRTSMIDVPGNIGRITCELLLEGTGIISMMVYI